jgi:hypothetical protein
VVGHVLAKDEVRVRFSLPAQRWIILKKGRRSGGLSFCPLPDETFFRADTYHWFFLKPLNKAVF